MSIETNKQAAVDFLQRVVKGRINEAYAEYVDMNGKHHNPYFPAGFAMLKQAMIDNETQFPNKQYMIKNVLGDGDLVAVHGRIVLAPDKNLEVTHLFRFAGGKIVEMWDVAMPWPADSLNKDGML